MDQRVLTDDRIGLQYMQHVARQLGDLLDAEDEARRQLKRVKDAAHRGEANRHAARAIDFQVKADRAIDAANSYATQLGPDGEWAKMVAPLLRKGWETARAVTVAVQEALDCARFKPMGIRDPVVLDTPVALRDARVGAAS